MVMALVGDDASGAANKRTANRDRPRNGLVRGLKRINALRDIHVSIVVKVSLLLFVLLLRYFLHPRHDSSRSSAVSTLISEAKFARGVVRTSQCARRSVQRWLCELIFDSSSLRAAQLDGIFVSITPGDPALWVGVMFVRKGNHSLGMRVASKQFGISCSRQSCRVHIITQRFTQQQAPMLPRCCASKYPFRPATLRFHLS